MTSEGHEQRISIAIPRPAFQDSLSQNKEDCQRRTQRSDCLPFAQESGKARKAIESGRHCLAV